MAVSTDGTELYYTVSSFDNTVSSIVEVQNVNGHWTSPEVTAFSSSSRDIEPFLSPDDQRLYFASNRPLNDGDTLVDYNIWYVDRVETGWSGPIALTDVINTDSDEYYPSVAANGNLYFTGAYPDAKGLEDIYMSRWADGNYLPPVSLDTAINTATYEFNAYVSPDEEVLIFSSFGRNDGLGGGDLYVSFKAGEKWTRARNLGVTVNSAKLDYCPFIHWSSNTFFFSSNRTGELPDGKSLEAIRKASVSTLNSMGNIYHVSWDKVVSQLR